MQNLRKQGRHYGKHRQISLTRGRRVSTGEPARQRSSCWRLCQGPADLRGLRLPTELQAVPVKCRN